MRNNRLYMALRRRMGKTETWGLKRRPPDRVIGENYLERWHIIPRNRYLNVYLHKFTGSDDDRALHDHPWNSVSFLLKGGAWEVFKSDGKLAQRRITRFWPVFRRATHAHRMVITRGPVWTIFITGPKVRSWGFLCPQGWRHWREFSTPDGNRVGRGCD